MDSCLFIGVDLGGTTLAAAAIDPITGRKVARHEVPTLAKQGSDAVTARMTNLIAAVLADVQAAEEQVCGIGVGVPGMLDLERGVVLLLPNLPGAWREVPLKAIIESEVGLPTFPLNDVRAFTLGEKTFGAGRGMDTVVCVAVGTGIGGGMVINGRLHMGIGGTAGEVGHQIIDPSGPPCGCGSRGCLEVFASGPAITAMALKPSRKALIPKSLRWSTTILTGSVLRLSIRQPRPMIKLPSISTSELASASASAWPT